MKQWVRNLLVRGSQDEPHDDVPANGGGSNAED
jgi:hypothetical protein